MAQELVFTTGERNLLDLAARGDGQAVALWSGLDHQQQQGLLVRAGPEQRRDLLFLCDDATAHVRALSALALRETIRAVPDLDAVVLLGCASGEQFDLILELDCLRGDGNDEERFRHWLECIAAGEAQLGAELWRSVDLSLLADLLEPSVASFDIPEGEDLLHLFETFGVSFHFTPDMVVTRRRFGRDDLVDEFMQALYAADGEVFNELCRMLQTGDREARQLTRAERGAERRAGIGLPTRAEAAVLRELVPLPFSLASASRSDTRSVVLPGVSEHGFFSLVHGDLRASDTWNEEADQHLAAELRWLANALLVLDGAEPDPEPIARAMERSQRMLGLGLEYLAGGDRHLAAELLGELPPRQIAQTGFTLVHHLHRGLATLPSDLAFPAGHGPLSQAGMGDWIAAQLSLDDPRLWNGGDGTRPIASIADLQAARGLLALLREGSR